MLTKSSLGWAAAGLVGVVAYCVYFDRKRRNDPNFKQKLRERRQNARLSRERRETCSAEIPDLSDYEAVQKFFIQEVQLGEELLATGDIENGIEHLSNAVAVCGQPQQLLQVLQQTLPPQVFHLLLQKLPVVSQKLARSVGRSGNESANESGNTLIETMAEDDVE